MIGKFEHGCCWTVVTAWSGYTKPRKCTIICRIFPFGYFNNFGSFILKGKKKAFYYVQVWLCHVSFIGVALLHVRLGFEVTTRTWLLLHVYLRKMVELFTHPDNFFYPPVAWWLRNGTILYFYRNCLLLLFFVPRGKNLVDSIFISIIFTLSTSCMTFGLCIK